MLFEKLLLHNARLDSLEVTDAEVLGEIDRRLTYYMQMFGSVEAFEAEYGKSVAEGKEFNEPVREQILAQKCRPKSTNLCAPPCSGARLFRCHPHRQPPAHSRRAQL